VFSLRSHQLFGGGLANGLGQTLTGQRVLGRQQTVVQRLSARASHGDDDEEGVMSAGSGVSSSSTPDDTKVSCVKSLGERDRQEEWPEA